jgi:hypothetical protein
MHKVIAKFEHKVGERIYQFTCDVDSPLGEVHDALSKFKAHIVTMIKQAQEAEEKMKAEKPKVEGDA